MRRTRFNSFLPALLVLFLFSLSGSSSTTAAQQTSLDQLEAKARTQYNAILEQFANSPGKQVFPLDARERVRLWQDELAKRFSEAGATVDEILKLNPREAAMWRELRDTLAVYAVPVGPPQTRSVFGAGEVKQRARLLESPSAVYPDEARAAGITGEVRLRLVLAADGTVKYLFPMKSLKHGLTEAAMEAARQIKFDPAIRLGQPVSQFATLSYEFKKGKKKSSPPYVPLHEFYF